MLLAECTGLAQRGGDPATCAGIREASDVLRRLSVRISKDNGSRMLWPEPFAGLRTEVGIGQVAAE